MGNQGASALNGIVRLTSVALVCAAVLVLGCKKSEKPPGEWDTFSFPADDFSIRAPIKPGESDSTIDTPMGPAPTRTYACSNPTDKGALVVMVSDIDIPPDSDVQQMLKGSVEGSASSFAGQVIAEDSVTKNGVPGAEYRIRGEHDELGSIEVFGQIYYTKSRSYQAITLIPLGDEKYREKSAAFIASFDFGSGSSGEAKKAGDD